MAIWKCQQSVWPQKICSKTAEMMMSAGALTTCHKKGVHSWCEWMKRECSRYVLCESFYFFFTSLFTWYEHCIQTITAEVAKIKRDKTKPRTSRMMRIEKRDLNKELKLLAMIEPTHRMFTITCALQRPREHLLLCSFVSILVFDCSVFGCFVFFSFLSYLSCARDVCMRYFFFSTRNNFIAFGDSSAIYHQ